MLPWGVPGLDEQHPIRGTCKMLVDRVTKCSA